MNMIALLGFTVLIGAVACGDGDASQLAQAAGALADSTAARPAIIHKDSQKTAAAGSPVEPLSAQEKQMYRDIARASWAYLDANYQPSTGLVNATPDWANTTLWDVGGQLIAFVAAKQLGFISPAEFDQRVAKTLGTLERTPLFRGAAFNKEYSTKTGAVSNERTGWSATDLGRLFVALKILAQQEPKFAEQAQRVVRRNDFAQIVKDGYLHGQLIGSSGKAWSYQEGRIGYEQYVARGFQLWGADVANALDVKKNAQPVTVLGVPLFADKRYQDRLVSEPFVLYGLELGLDGDMRDLAANLLKAQEARYKATGTITIASEDAVSVPPQYFYYYCVYCSGKPFVIDASTPGNTLDSPRWVSTKAAFGWHVLLPSEYTKLAVDYVSGARDPKRGWASGVFEGTRKSTQTFDINTASVMMEVAFYRLRGNKPLLEDASLVP